MLWCLATGSTRVQEVARPDSVVRLELVVRCCRLRAGD